MNQIVAIGSRLQRAIDKVKDLGLSLAIPDTQPIARIIEKIEDVDKDKVLVIARTIGAMQSFDAVVAENLASTNYGSRFDAITAGFKSIIDDLKRQVGQEEKGGPSFVDRIGNVYMKLSRGDVAHQFSEIEAIYKDVIQDSGKTLDRQSAILDAYSDARMALEEGEVAAIEILERVKVEYEAAAVHLEDLNGRLAALPAETSLADKSKLELERDEAVNALRSFADDRYEIAKKLAEMLTVSYSVTETVFGKYNQAHKVLERLHQKAVIFFEIQRPVMTAMKATYTGILVANELSKTQTAMEEGLNSSLETLATLGNDVLKQGVRVGHSIGIKAESVKKLVDATVEFTMFVGSAVDEARELATVEANNIRAIVEDGKRNTAEFAARSTQRAIGR